MKSKKRFSLLILIMLLFFISYQGIIYANQNANEQQKICIDCNLDKKIVKSISMEKYEHIKEYDNLALLKYTAQLTGLNKNDIKSLFDECKEKGIDVFIVLGLMKVESNFNPLTVGTKGERGLGQLMENTAQPVAHNLGLEYDPEKLFQPHYNIELFMTQLKYLYEFYGHDIHKTLTAYNRGQHGLQKYIASRQSTYRDLAMSEYSMRVIEYAVKFKEEFAYFEE